MDYDDVLNQFVMLTGVSIADEPVFSHRGVSLDTSRNFIGNDTIKSILDGMAHSKVSDG